MPINFLPVIPINYIESMIKTPKKYEIDISREISEKSELMALPEAVMQILKSAAKDEISIDSLSSIISHDPALTSRLLKIANSPFYGLSHKVSSIQQAIMVLGITTVKCLALSAAIFDREKLRQDIGVDIITLYSNIISIAVTSRKIAVACGYHSPEDAFTCGLLHDIGLLYLLHHYPRQYRDALMNASQSESLFDEEKGQFGMTHDQVGGLIAQKWCLPEPILSGIAHHNSCGDRDSRKLDDVIRLAVALNRDIYSASDRTLEDKITKISVISARLGINSRQLDDIAVASAKDAVSFAKSADIEIADFETILGLANRELFSAYMSIQNLFRERQELTRRLLEEERERGLLEAKHIAISTLSHYINNASMAISGNCQVLKMLIVNKTPQEVVASIPPVLDIISEAVYKIAAVLEELSELSSLENIEYLNQSKIIDFDERIKARMSKLKTEHGLVLPEEAASKSRT